MYLFPTKLHIFALPLIYLVKDLHSCLSVSDCLCVSLSPALLALSLSLSLSFFLLLIVALLSSSFFRFFFPFLFFFSTCFHHHLLLLPLFLLSLLLTSSRSEVCLSCWSLAVSRRFSPPEITAQSGLTPLVYRPGLRNGYSPICHSHSSENCKCPCWAFAKNRILTVWVHTTPFCRFPSFVRK